MVKRLRTVNAKIFQSKLSVYVFCKLVDGTDAVAYLVVVLVVLARYFKSDTNHFQPARNSFDIKYNQSI